MPDPTEPKKDFEYPPFTRQIFGEIAAKLPEGHLRTYWEHWATILKIPNNDPVLAAVVMMGTAAVIGQQTPEQQAATVDRFEEIAKRNVILMDIRLNGVGRACREINQDLAGASQSIRTARRESDLLQKRSNQLVDLSVERAIAARSYFERYPLAVGYLSAGLLATGFLIGIGVGFLFWAHN